MSTLDIRWPLGLIFTLIGIILAAYGPLADTSIEGAGAMDTAWGGVLLLFGLAMLLLARRAVRSGKTHA